MAEHDVEANHGSTVSLWFTGQEQVISIRGGYIPKLLSQREMFWVDNTIQYNVPLGSQ